jgi:hypothetical protein
MGVKRWNSETIHPMNRSHRMNETLDCLPAAGMVRSITGQRPISAQNKLKSQYGVCLIKKSYRTDCDEFPDMDNSTAI